MSQTGLFPVTYVVATPAIGAPVLTLSLLVNTPAKKVSGIAKITQSTNPPLVFHADVWGRSASCGWRRAPRPPSS